MTSKNGLNLNMRTEPDFWVKSIDFFIKASWSLLIISILMAFFTLPFMRSFLNDFLNLSLSTKKDSLFLNINLGLFVSTFIISAFGAFINTKRSRRRNDKLEQSLINILFISGIISISWFVFV